MVSATTPHARQLRARYADSLSDMKDVRGRLRNYESFTYPVDIFCLGIEHWSDVRPFPQVEDPAQHTPLYGAVILLVGSDSAVADNPEITALIAELMRIHQAWERY